MLAGGEAGGGSAFGPGLRVALGTGQGLPRLDADEADRLCRGRPDEGIRVALDVADDVAAGVLFVDAQRPGAQARHAEAVVGEEIVRERDGGDVLPPVAAPAGQQAVGVSIQDHRAFGLVEAELVIGGGVVGIKGDAEGRVVADAEAQLLCSGFGVCDRQGVVDGLSFQPEGAGEDKIEGETLGLDRIVRAQFQLDGVALGAEQGVLQIPCKAVLAALVYKSFQFLNPV